MRNPLDSRYMDLVRLLRRYGRSDLVSGAQLDEFAVDGADADDPVTGDHETAEQFAADLERMGPTFIKLGQLLSTRFDLLPPAYTTALTRLQGHRRADPLRRGARGRRARARRDDR